MYVYIYRGVTEGLTLSTSSATWLARQPDRRCHRRPRSAPHYRRVLSIYLYTHMHIYICTCIHTYIYTCMHTYIHTHTHTHIYICIYICIYIYVCVHTCIYIYIGGLTRGLRVNPTRSALARDTHTDMYIYVFIQFGLTRRRPRRQGRAPRYRRAAHSRALAFTRYCFTQKLYFSSQSSFYTPPPAKPTLLQYYCTTIVQYTPPRRPPLFMPYTLQYW